MVFLGRRKKLASSPDRHVDVFQRTGVGRQCAAFEAYAGSDEWSSMKDGAKNGFDQNRRRAPNRPKPRFNL
jgi:hypothetical protein